MINSITHLLKSGVLSVSPTSRSQAAQFLPLKPVSLRTIIGSLLLGVMLACPAMLFSGMFPVWKLHQKMALELVAAPLTGFLVHVFVGPLIEELVYRGLFLQLGRRYLPISLAIVLSSLAFALTHLVRGPANALSAFLFSLVISWIFIRSGSLIPSYICHIAVNYVAFYLILPLSGYMDALLAVSPGSRIAISNIMPLWWVGIALLLAAGCFVFLRREFARQKSGLDATTRLTANVA